MRELRERVLVESIGSSVQAVLGFNGSSIGPILRSISGGIKAVGLFGNDFMLGRPVTGKVVGCSFCGGSLVGGEK